MPNEYPGRNRQRQDSKSDLISVREYLEQRDDAIKDKIEIRLNNSDKALELQKRQTDRVAEDAARKYEELLKSHVALATSVAEVKSRLAAYAAVLVIIFSVLTIALQLYKK
jgi:hypothetical protein